MGKNKNIQFELDVAPTQIKLEKWRNTPGHSKCIPEQIFNEATVLASKHGVSKVCKKLKLCYQSIKNRLSAQSESISKEEPGFVQLNLQSPPRVTEWGFDVSQQKDGTYQILLKGFDSNELLTMISHIMKADR